MSGPLFFRTRAHVLVCTGPSCARRGSGRLFASVWSACERRRHAYYAGGEVRLTESGCQGACSHGPNAIAYYLPRAPEAPSPGGLPGQLAEAWYHGLDEPRLLGLVEALDRGEPPPSDGRYDR